MSGPAANETTLDPARKSAVPARSHIVLDGEHFERIMGMVLDRLEAMQGQQSDAIAAGIKSVIFDPATFDKLAAAVSNHAAARARDRLGGGMLWFLRKFLTVGVIVLALFFFVAKIAGWEVAAKVARIVSEVLQ